MAKIQPLLDILSEILINNAYILCVLCNLYCILLCFNVSYRLSACEGCAFRML